MIDLLIWGPAVTSIVLLYIGHFAKIERLQFWGSVLLAVSFGIDSSVFFYFRHFGMGVVFLLPAIAQSHALIAAALRRKRGQLGAENKDRTI